MSSPSSSPPPSSPPSPLCVDVTGATLGIPKLSELPPKEPNPPEVTEGKEPKAPKVDDVPDVVVVMGPSNGLVPNDEGKERNAPGVVVEEEVVGREPNLIGALSTFGAVSILVDAVARPLNDDEDVEVEGKVEEFFSDALICEEAVKEGTVNPNPFEECSLTGLHSSHELLSLSFAISGALLARIFSL